MGLLGICLVLGLSTLAVLPEAAHATSAGTLEQGGSLRSGQRINSVNGQWYLYMGSSGNVQLRRSSDKSIVWATKLSPKPGSGAHFDLGTDGALVLYNGAGISRWSSGTTGEPSDLLRVTDAGTLELRSKGDLLLWSNAENGVNTEGQATPNHTNTLGVGQSMVATQALWSSDLAWKMGIDNRCRIAITHVSDSQVAWTSPNNGVSGGCASGGFITEQTDGNFAIFQNSSTALWWSNSTSSPDGGRVTLGTDGRLSNLSGGGLLRWESPDPSVPTTTTPAGPGADTLNFGSTLSTSGQLVSSNGRYVAKISDTCHLTIIRTADSATRWTSANYDHAQSCTLAVGTGGDVFLDYVGSTSVVWTAGISGAVYDHLVLRNSGVLAAVTVGGIAAWTSTDGSTGGNNSTLGIGQVLRSGQFLLSESGTYQAIMQSDGNFVTCHSEGLHCTSPTWSTRTNGNTGAYFMVRRSDSNLVVFDTSKNWKWASFTSGDIGERLVMQSDGNLGFYGPVGALWGSMNGIIWSFPKSVGVYAYPDPQSSVMGDGWGILGITGGLGTTASPWVDLTKNADFQAGMAIQNSGRSVPWMSYWTVSGPITQSTLLGSPCATQNATPDTEVATQYFWAGLASGASVARKIDGYATQGLRLKPDYVILDPEGYPDYNSGFACRIGGASSADAPAFAALIRGWVAGLSSVDPALKGAFYATQSQFRAFNAAQLRTTTGAYIPGFLAVAFGYSGNPSKPLVSPSPISSSIPYGAAAVANSNLKGIVAFYAGVPFSAECSSWTGVAAQVLANWGTPMNSLQFDPGRACTPSGVSPR